MRRPDAAPAPGDAAPRPTGPARLFVVRHPETDWNHENRWQGHADLPLNARGREQMRRTYEELRGEPLAAIYASDLLRAHETATFLGVKLGLRPRITSALRERAMGEWEGRTPEEARAEWPDLYPLVEADPLRRPPPGGESFGELYRRVMPVLQRIARLHPGESAVVVTHGGVLKVLLCALLGLDLTRRETLGMGNGALVLFEVEADRWRIVKPERLAERQCRDELDEALR